MKLAIWTQNKAKIKGLTDAASNCVYFEGKVEVEGFNVSSWVNDQPKSLEETILWAKNRAENIKKHWNQADFYVGMEWWLTEIENKVYLFWVTYVLNNSWKWHFWLTQFQEIPEIFKTRVFDGSEELWPVQDELMWDTWNNHKWWSFSVWTDGMLSRSESFEAAFFCAISPFFNKYYK